MTLRALAMALTVSCAKPSPPPPVVGLIPAAQPGGPVFEAGDRDLSITRLVSRFATLEPDDPYVLTRAKQWSTAPVSLVVLIDPDDPASASALEAARALRPSSTQNCSTLEIIPLTLDADAEKLAAFLTAAKLDLTVGIVQDLDRLGLGAEVPAAALVDHGTVAWRGAPGDVPTELLARTTVSADLQTWKRLKPRERFPFLMELGERVYEAHCAVCHGNEGEGYEGVFPPLTGAPNRYGSPQDNARIILEGMMGEIVVGGTVYNSVMPGMGRFLCDLDIAAAATFHRNSWANADGLVTPDDVEAMRRE